MHVAMSLLTYNAPLACFCSALDTHASEGKIAMAGHKLRVEWNAEDTPEFFRALYRAERDGKLKERLQALWLLRRGWTATQVAAVVGVHYRTVHRWVRW